MTSAGLDKRAAWLSITTPELHFGRGALDGIGQVVAGTGARTPLVVTDPSVRAAGWPDLVARALEAAGGDVELWAGVRRNAEEAVVEDCRAAARAGGHDVLVAVGGGSVVDTAKACSGLLASGGRPSDHEGVGRLTAPGPPVVAVPTTPGSGAEASRHAVIVARSGRRFAVSGRGLVPRIIVADPRTCATAPHDVVVDTALDALLHAIEAFLARAATPMSDLFALEAIARVTRSLSAAASARDDETSADLMLGCLLAAFAMANANACLVHALGYPLSATYGLSHGRANALMAPAALRWLLPASPHRHAELLERWAAPAPADDRPTDLAAALERLLGTLSVSPGLAARGVPRADLPRLAASAAGYRPILENTPAPVYEAQLLALYEAAWPVPARRRVA